MRRSVIAIVLVSSLTAAACGGPPETTASATPAPTVMKLAPENVATAATAELSSGPMVSGQLTPAREATVRAQVGGSLVSLAVDRGQSVKSGAVIARIASRDLDTAMAAAEAQIRSADSALGVAQTELARTESLVKGGALATRDLEQARNTYSSAEAQVAAAKARQRSVWQQIDDTSVKAPFGGIVSERPANMGDVVQPGTAILTIIDPSSMRLEALVPSESIQQVRPGAKVRFTIRGVAGDFTGTVDRLSATADPVTRQVSIFVTLPNVGGKLIAGLFAEGRVEAATRTGIVIPQAAVDETGPMATVTRIANGKAERVPVELGLRQAETEMVEITKGLSAGDVVIRGSAKAIAAGTPVEVVK